MSVPPFVHLHCHSQYSLLDGAGTISGLLQRAKALQMNALALTDHGNLHGAVKFYLTARELGIKPILGLEAYVAPGSRLEKDSGAMKDSYSHLTLLAQDRTGFKNLLKLSTASFLEGFYFRPRIDKQLLAEHNQGLICLSGCMSSELSRLLLAGGEAALKKAEETADWFRSVFGDRYFIEIQNNGLRDQAVVIERAVALSQRMGIPLVATSDVHYVDQEDHEAQDILLCINTGRARSDPNRMRMETRQFYLRSPEEMYAVFSGLEDALRRTQQIADSVHIELELGQRHFPVFVPPNGQSSEEFLRQLCLENLKQRYADQPHRCRDGQLSEEVLSRLNRELAVINKLGFANYFLIVWDFVRFARERGIPASARGSGVGSLVSYALYLSNVCPLEYGLLFERFLDENRREAPDIDIDFCKQRRGEVIEYVRQKYGAENVAQIGTFGTLAARAAIRDVGRALGMPLARVDAIAALVPKELKITLAEALKKSEDLRKQYDSDPAVRELLELAMKIEGLTRNVGTHAAGVVIADKPLTEYVPLQFVQNKDEVITQWSMGDVERAGLLKMDLLGLRNLTIMSKAVEMINRSAPEPIDPYRLPLDDKKTFALLCSGETKGVFQLESGGIRDLLQRLRPDGFQDIVATNALYRPGPLEGGMVDEYIQVKHGRKKAEFKHPVLKEVLEETHGVMVYQEQVMQILNRLGGIALANAYSCIKAISKKKAAEIAKYRDEFIKGAQARGMSRRQAEEVFGLIEKFAGYGFNKSHSTSYALITYITAYLKAHYPVEFMAALLSSDIEGRNFTQKDSLVEHIEDCRRMGIEVLPPHVNASFAEFTVEAGKIRYGLSAIKGCGEAAAKAIAEQRAAGGPFRSLFDFCQRVDPAAVNRSTIEALVKAGAMDGLGGTRAQLLAAVDRAIQSGTAAASDRRRGQLSLFDDGQTEEQDQPPLPVVPDWTAQQRSAAEREVLGFYLTSHPLAQYSQTLENYCTHTIAQIAELQHRTEVLVGGLVSAVKFGQVKNPKPGAPSRYAMFDLEDHSATIRCVMWPEQCALYGAMLHGDAALAIRGVVDRRPGSETVNLIVNEMFPLEQLEGALTQGVLIRLLETDHGIDALERLYHIVCEYPGNKDLQLLLCLADGTQLRCRCEKLRIAADPQLRRRVDELLGPGNFRPLLSRPVTNRGGNGRS
jgi:DNA polymerase-3 subunit alpha